MLFNTVLDAGQLPVSLIRYKGGLVVARLLHAHDRFQAIVTPTPNGDILIDIKLEAGFKGRCNNEDNYMH